MQRQSATKVRHSIASCQLNNSDGNGSKTAQNQKLQGNHRAACRVVSTICVPFSTHDRS